MANKINLSNNSKHTAIWTKVVENYEPVPVSGILNLKQGNFTQDKFDRQLDIESYITSLKKAGKE